MWVKGLLGFDSGTQGTLRVPGVGVRGGGEGSSHLLLAMMVGL